MLKNKILVYIISYLLLLFFIRLLIPQYIKILLFSGVLLYFITSFIFFIKRTKINYQEIFHFKPILFIGLIYLLVFILTPNKQLSLLKEGFNSFIIIIFMFSIYFINLSKSSFNENITRFQLFVIFICGIFSLLGILKLVFQLYGFYIDFIEVRSIGYPLGASLSLDNNSYALAYLIAIFFSIPHLFKTQNLRIRLLFQFFLFFSLLNVFFSTSRRGLLFAFIFIFFVIIIYTLSFINKRIDYKNFIKNTKVVLILIFLFTLLYFLIVIKINPKIRNKWLANSSLSTSEVNLFFNLLTLKGTTILEGESTYNEIDKKLWSMEFDSRFPYSGWASGNYKLVKNLSSYGLISIPEDAVGAKVSWETKSNTNSGLFYQSSLFDGKTTFGKRYVASVYCYLSKDFNGGDVRIATSSGLNGLRAWSYDKSKLGTWQKLQTSFYADNLDYLVKFYVLKRVDLSLNSFNGFVIFAYPELREVDFDPINPISWAGTNFTDVQPLSGNNIEIVPIDSRGYKLDKYSQSIKLKNFSYSSTILVKGKFKSDKQRIVSSVYVYVSEDFTGEKVRLASGGKLYSPSATYYDMARKGSWQKLTLSTWGCAGDEYWLTMYLENPNSSDFSNLKGYAIFAHPNYHMLDFDSKDPLSFALNNFTIEYPITGKNSKILPISVKGCRYDKKAEGRISGNNFYSATVYNNAKVSKGDTVIASVYCYASSDFNGDDVSVEVRGRFLDANICRYNLIEKGKWVKLQVSGVVIQDCSVEGVYLFMKKNAEDFSNLEGHVTFAYPELKVIKPKKVSQLLDSLRNKTLKIEKASVFPKISLFSILMRNNFEDFFSRSLKSDSLYHKEMINDHFSGPRVDRWRYAIHLYRYEYKWWQKIVGGGFGYTKKFAETFSTPNEKLEFDYPHNPFLSVLLYSGILGLAVYIWFLVKAVYYYWIYRKEYWTLGLAFGVTFFFAFFSSNSPFDPAILGIFSILPYFIHYYNLKDQQSTNE